MKQRLLILILGMVLKNISPILRAALDAAIKALYVKAKATDIEFDDMLVETLAEILDIELD